MMVLGAVLKKKSVNKKAEKDQKKCSASHNLSMKTLHRPASVSYLGINYHSTLYRPTVVFNEHSL